MFYLWEGVHGSNPCLLYMERIRKVWYHLLIPTMLLHRIISNLYTLQDLSGGKLWKKPRHSHMLSIEVTSFVWITKKWSLIAIKSMETWNHFQCQVHFVQATLWTFSQICQVNSIEILCYKLATSMGIVFPIGGICLQEYIPYLVPHLLR